MKKITPRRRRYLFILRDQRLRKEHKARIAAARPRKPKPVKVIAPPMIDLYGPGNHKKTTAFLRDLRGAVGTGSRVIICFRKTARITAAAGLLVLAEIERLTKRYGSDRFGVIRPEVRRDKFGNPDRTVEAVLEQIGVFRALKQKPVNLAGNHPLVGCWQVESGYAASGRAAGEMLKAIWDRLPEATRKPLYRGAIEALSNCVEHAYIGARADGLRIDDKRWWMFTAQIDSKLVVLVCDLGVGIPNTIRQTQSSSLLDLIFDKFGFQPVNDAAWIKAATLVKETRTEATHRGKGGGDIRQLVQVDRKSTLSIFSNKGYYRTSTVVSKTGSGLSQPLEFILDHANSIFGTIVEWSIELA